MHRNTKFAVLSSLLLLPMLLALRSLPVAAQSLSFVGLPFVDPAKVTETTAPVLWYTSLDASSVVRYGKTSALGLEQANKVPGDNLGELFDEMTMTHRVVLLELAPGTKYYFQVRSTDASGAILTSEIGSFQTSAGSCDKKVWECGVWGACAADGSQTRTCKLISDCPQDTSAAPEVSQKCVYVPPCDKDVWDCAAWSACAASGIQTRTCALKTDCPAAETPKPAMEQACTPPIPATEKKAAEPVPGKETVEENRGEQPSSGAEGTAPSDAREQGPAAATPENPTPGESGAGAVPAATPAELELKSAFMESQGWSAAGGSAPAAAPSVDDRDPLCRDNGIGRERCQSWLEAKFAKKSCAEAGISTKSSCVKFLTDQNNGTFPGCEGKTDEECARAKDLATAGYLETEAKARVDSVIVDAVKENVVVSVPGLTAVSDEAARASGWYPSAATPGMETSTAVTITDSDHDGLPDDVEKRLGTDPYKADTDGDGVNDAEEVRKGADPLKKGTGEAPKELAPVDRALVHGRPLEQPRGAGQVDPTFVVNVSRAAPAAPAPGKAPAGNNMVRGRALPRTTVTIFVYSYVPMVVTAVTDDNGNFTYDLGQSINDGEHTVYVALNDDTGKLVRKSEPISFFIKEARAVTLDDFLQPDQPSPAEPMNRIKTAYIYGAVALVFVALAAVYLLVIRRTKQRAA